MVSGLPPNRTGELQIVTSAWAASSAACMVKLEGFTSLIECFLVFTMTTLGQDCPVRRNSEFGTSGGFELSDERSSVLYWYEWHKRRLRLRVR